MARTSAHAQSDQLRQQSAAEDAKARQLDTQLAQAKTTVEDVAAELKEAYAAEDDKKVRQLRKRLEDAEANVIDLQHRLSGAQLRAERAREAVDRFPSDHALELLRGDLPRFRGQVTARRLPPPSPPFPRSIARSCSVRGTRASSAAGAGCTSPRSTRRSPSAPRGGSATSGG